MMKKLMTLLMIFTLSSQLLGCNNAKETEDSSINTTVSTETEAEAETETNTDSSVEVDKGLLDVTVTLPASMVENEDGSTFDPIAYNEEKGFKQTIVNEDGSVSITMSKNKHKEVLAQLAQEIETNCNELIDGTDTPYIKEIKATDSYKKFTVSVDKSGYESAFIDMTPFTLAIYAALYQQFEGSTLYSEIVIQDVETNEVISTIIYPDDFNVE